MYNDFISYLSKYIDIDETFYFSLSVIVALAIFFLAFYLAKRENDILKIAIDKWHKGEKLTKREEKIFYEYQDYIHK